MPPPQPKSQQLNPTHPQKQRNPIVKTTHPQKQRNPIVKTTIGYDQMERKGHGQNHKNNPTLLSRPLPKNALNDEMATKAICSFPHLPPQLPIPNPEHLLCGLHESLVTRKVVPDIYQQVPSTLLFDRRFNILNSPFYGVFSKRQMAGAYTKRKIGKLNARWSGRGQGQNVYGLSGCVVGRKYVLNFVYKVGNREIDGGWAAEEHVSTCCEDGESSIVVLGC